MSREEDFRMQLERRMLNEVTRRTKAEAAIAAFRSLLESDEEMLLKDALVIVQETILDLPDEELKEVEWSISFPL